MLIMTLFLDVDNSFNKKLIKGNIKKTCKLS